MYEYIQGEVAEISPAHIVVGTPGGVGYYLNISLGTYTQVGNLSEIRLFTHFIVREDVQVLYGFFDRTERDLFRLLIGVSGVGGNTARTILSSFTPEELRTVIATGKADILKGVKGLGLKTAQKIIVELKDKVGSAGDEPIPNMTRVGAQAPAVVEEALSAMTMLGFSRAASEKVLRQIVKEQGEIPVEEVIRIALKKM